MDQEIDAECVRRQRSGGDLVGGRVVLEKVRRLLVTVVQRAGRQTEPCHSARERLRRPWPPAHSECPVRRSQLPVPVGEDEGVYRAVCPVRRSRTRARLEARSRVPVHPGDCRNCYSSPGCWRRAAIDPGVELLIEAPSTIGHVASHVHRQEAAVRQLHEAFLFAVITVQFVARGVPGVVEGVVGVVLRPALPGREHVAIGQNGRVAIAESTLGIAGDRGPGAGNRVKDLGGIDFRLWRRLKAAAGGGVFTAEKIDLAGGEHGRAVEQSRKVAVGQEGQCAVGIVARCVRPQLTVQIGRDIRRQLQQDAAIGQQHLGLVSRIVIRHGRVHDRRVDLRPETGHQIAPLQGLDAQPSRRTPNVLFAGRCMIRGYQSTHVAKQVTDTHDNAPQSKRWMPEQGLRDTRSGPPFSPDGTVAGRPARRTGLVLEPCWSSTTRTRLDGERGQAENGEQQALPDETARSLST